jgi:hypothetical protein
MPRPRTPDNILKLTRNYRPSRHGPIPKPEGAPLGKPPAGLDKEFHAAWKDIVTAGDGRLVAADAVLVEVAARCLTAIRGAEARGQDSANLLRAMAALQIDPAHRRAIAKPAEINEFDAF